MHFSEILRFRSIYYFCQTLYPHVLELFELLLWQMAVKVKPFIHKQLPSLTYLINFLLVYKLSTRPECTQDLRSSS